MFDEIPRTQLEDTFLFNEDARTIQKLMGCNEYKLAEAIQLLVSSKMNWELIFIIPSLANYGTNTLNGKFAPAFGAYSSYFKSFQELWTFLLETCRHSEWAEIQTIFEIIGVTHIKITTDTDLGKIVRDFIMERGSGGLTLILPQETKV